jgi:hypothetical protein
MVCTAHIGGKPTINLLRQFPLLSQSVHQMRSSQRCPALLWPFIEDVDDRLPDVIPAQDSCQTNPLDKGTFF